MSIRKKAHPLNGYVFEPNMFETHSSEFVMKITRHIVSAGVTFIKITHTMSDGKRFFKIDWKKDPARLYEKSQMFKSYLEWVHVEGYTILGFPHQIIDMVRVAIVECEVLKDSTESKL